MLSKKPKTKNAEKTMTCSMTDLPEALIISIISCLPFPEAYRFCLLRKDWYEKSLWLQCLCFDFHDIDYYYTRARRYWLGMGNPARSMVLKNMGRQRYVNFLDETITKVSSKEITKLSFRMHYKPHYRQNIDNWIRIAVDKCIKELSLDFSDGDPIEPERMQMVNQQYSLPNYLYMKAASIRVFSVNSCGLGFRVFESFVSLRSMSLTRVLINSFEVKEMGCTCPLLESLSLVQCHGLSKVELCFNFMRLMKLVVKHCLDLSSGFELSVPRLEYFEYVGKPKEFVLRNLGALKVVMLDYKKDPEMQYNLEQVRQIFDGFSAARIVKVCTDFVQVLALDYLQYSQWSFGLMQIQHLQLKTAMEKFELPAIMFLIKSSPHLKTLTINIKTGFRQTLLQQIVHIGSPELPEEVWDTQGWRLYHLERVNIEGFTGKKKHNDFFQFIIKISPSLHNLVFKATLSGKASSASSSASARALQDLRMVAQEYGNAEIVRLI